MASPVHWHRKKSSPPICANGSIDQLESTGLDTLYCRIFFTESRPVFQWILQRQPALSLVLATWPDQYCADTMTIAARYPSEKEQPPRGAIVSPCGGLTYLVGRGGVEPSTL